MRQIVSDPGTRCQHRSVRYTFVLLWHGTDIILSVEVVLNVLQLECRCQNQVTTRTPNCSLGVSSDVMTIPCVSVRFGVPSIFTWSNWSCVVKLLVFCAFNSSKTNPGWNIRAKTFGPGSGLRGVCLGRGPEYKHMLWYNMKTLVTKWETCCIEYVIYITLFIPCFPQK